MNDLIVNIDKNEYKIQYDKDVENRFFLNDNTYDIELINKNKNGFYTFSINNHIYQISADGVLGNKLNINHNGIIYNIEASDELQKMLNKFIANSASNNKSNAGNLKAPMPGLVIKILVELGAEVNEDDKIIVIEAMKMENTLKAPKSGIIKSIKVKEGAAVNKGDILIEIE